MTSQAINLFSNTTNKERENDGVWQKSKVGFKDQPRCTPGP